MEVQRRRRIRISFSDPDATDSDDSGEDDATSTSASYGKTTMVICLHHCSSSSAKKNQNTGGCGGGAQQRPQAIRSSSSAPASCRARATAVGSPPAMKRCRGVYERQPGRWAAEFRNHRLKARHWIGTFATEAEATAAYDDFERRFVPSTRRCGGLPPPPPPMPALERGGCAGGGVHRASQSQSHLHRQRRQPRPPDTETRQIVQALAAAGVVLPPLASARCVSNSTSAPSPRPPLVPAFENAEQQADDALPSVHSFWADVPAADEDLVGLADLGHLPLPFSDGSMDFDPADLSLFDGFL